MNVQPDPLPSRTTQTKYGTAPEIRLHIR